MADKSDPYIFRVVNGRVIPIKVTGEQRELRQKLQYARKKNRYHEKKKRNRQRYAEAAGLVALGVGLVAGSRFGAGRFAKYAKSRLRPTTQRIKELTAIPAASPAHAKAIKKLKSKVAAQTKITRRFRDFLNISGVAAGATLTASGVEKGIETYRGKPLSNREKVATVVGTTSTLLGARAFKVGFKTGTGGKIGALYKKMKLGWY